MRTHVEFRSDKFPAYAGEDAEVNPESWGRRLAEFLAIKLQAAGIETSPIYAEDWGWVVPVVHAPFPLWVGCSHYPEYPDGYLVFIEPRKPAIRRFPFFSRIDTRAAVTRLADAIAQTLAADPGIYAIRWWDEHEK